MGITLFQGFTDPAVTTFEKIALIIVVVVAILGLLYAVYLARQVSRQSEGTEKMRHLSGAIQAGGRG